MHLRVSGGYTILNSKNSNDNIICLNVVTFLIRIVFLD